MDRLTVKDIYFLVKGKSRLTSEEYNAIKDLKLFDLIIETAFNMLIGDGAYTPDSPEYKVLMPLCAILDSIIDAQPFVNVKDKLLGGYSVSDIVEPMLFNNSVPDRAGTLELNEIPQLRMETPIYKSQAGAILMGIIYVLVLLLSPLAPIAIAIGLPVLTVKKRRIAKKHQEPFYRYS
jgi:hypothetical protein